MDSPKENYINSVNLNIDTDFPYLVLDVRDDESYPWNPGFQVMHWHEDLQFIYVLDGMIEVRTLDNAVQIQAGNGVFINQNVVHDVQRLGSCHYNSLLFPARLLEFYPASPAKALVDRVTENKQLAMLYFAPCIDWQNDILVILWELLEIEQNKTEFYVYEVLVRLCSIWLLMQKNMDMPAVEKESRTTLRMQKMLRYIAEHFSENIALGDIARSANVSKSECSRCFKLNLNTTPYQYLTEFRLSKAAQLLKNTDEPVGKISASVGFHQMSHFGKCFREKTGFSPQQYRKMET